MRWSGFSRSRIEIVIGLVVAGCTSATLGAIDANVASDLGAPDTLPDANDWPRCSSGMLWDERFAEGEGMHPGRLCVQCHVDENSASGEGDAPVFGVAGTVFPSLHEPDDCLATSAAGAVVTIYDGLGNVYTAPVNANGNFFVDAPAFRPPYTADITFEGRTRSMSEARMEPDCNGCHTENGASDAPGRIVLP